LYLTAEVIRQVAILTQPFMPESGRKLLDLLGIPADKRDFAALSGRLVPGTKLGPIAPVFPRYVEPEEKAAE
jgi:methionyl-tRNA synthetase